MVGNKRGECVILGSIGSICRRMGDYLSAVDYYNQSLAIAQEIGDKRIESMHLCTLEKPLEFRESLIVPLGLLHQAPSIAKEIGEKDLEGHIYAHLGRRCSDFVTIKRLSYTIKKR